MNAALAGLVILVIGDSHMMHMMSNLNTELEDQGAVVHSYAMCGATPADWVYPSALASWAGCGRAERHERGPILIEAQKTEPTYVVGKLIEQHHPNLIIVQTGDTLAGYGNAKIDRPWAIDQVRALTGRIAASKIPCDWVGPTWGQDRPPFDRTDASVKEMAQFLSQSVAPCKYIDSTTFARPGEWPTIDGTHLLPDGYRKWSMDITSAVVRMNGQGALSSR